MLSLFVGIFEFAIQNFSSDNQQIPLVPASSAPAFGLFGLGNCAEKYSNCCESEDRASDGSNDLRRGHSSRHWD